MLNVKAMNEELFFVEWWINEITFVLQPGPSLDVDIFILFVYTYSTGAYFEHTTTIQFIVLLFPDNEVWTLQHVWMVLLHFSIYYDLEPKKLIIVVYQVHL